MSIESDVRRLPKIKLLDNAKKARSLSVLWFKPFKVYFILFNCFRIIYFSQEEYIKFVCNNNYLNRLIVGQIAVLHSPYHCKK